jgi:hypothetical protein
LPEGATSRLWQAFLDHLIASLRGRDLQTPDNHQYLIEVRGLDLGVGTMRIALFVGVRWRCGDKWFTDGNQYDLTWVRLGGKNEWGQAKTTSQIHHYELCSADAQ